MPEPGPSSAATGPVEGPVEPWCTVDDLAQAARVDLAHAVWAIRLASVILWAGSGRRYGLVSRTLRPWRPGCAGGCRSYPACAHPRPTGQGYPWWLQTGRRDARVNQPPPGLDRLTIPGPVAEVVRVVVNGDELDLDRVKIGRNRRDLLLVDGRWPHRNNLAVDPDTAGADTSPPAWAVHYRQGRNVPDEARGLAAILAAELTRARTGEANVPSGVTRIARRGVTMDFTTPEEVTLGGAGHTGVDAVDRWLKAVNPERLTRPAKVVRRRQVRDWDWIDA